MKTTMPAIIGQIGDTIYYSTNFTFRQIAEMVSPVNSELHTAYTIKQEIQRSLSNNYLKIKEYILSRSDYFFNSLVLAVYDGNPLWTEIRFELDTQSYPNVGILSFNGEEKIFPVDGQHRVEGIRSALKEKPELASETIGVILIGHRNTPEGMEKSRRIFSTLNRYAKPVKMGDIIALDEDDIIAIVTRNQLEHNPLFIKDRVKVINSKAIPVSDKKSFTTLITLYDCHKELFRVFSCSESGKLLTDSKLKDYLKSRPDDSVIDRFDAYVTSFWDSFSHTFPEVTSYISDESPKSAEKYRSPDNGGNLLFRPIALGPLVSAVSTVTLKSKGISILDVLSKYSVLDRRVSSAPWSLVIWNPKNHKIIVKHKTLVRLLMILFYGNEYLSDSERKDLIIRYSTVFNITSEEAEERLEHIFDK